MSAVGVVIVTLPTGEKLKLVGLRARLVRTIATDCNYIDDYELGRMEINWAPNRRIDVRATRFHQERE